MTATFTRREVNLGLIASAVALAASKLSVPQTTPLFDYVPAGGHYYDLYDALDQMKTGDALQLVPEPDNLYDKYAIKTFWRDHMIGYIPRKANEPIFKLLERQADVRAVIADFTKVRHMSGIPEDLVFTSLSSGDPRIRLQLYQRRII